MSKRRRPNDKAAQRIQRAAESVIRRNSPIRNDYDERNCQPPMAMLQGRSAIEVAGHVVARLHEVGSDVAGLDQASTYFQDNAIPVRVIDLATI